jgi:AcrR family transcriptional regulator
VAKSTAAAAAPSLREQRRVQQQDLSRAQMLDAAEAVFGEKGYYDATLKDIAERAEFSVGSVYSFFENKDDLFTSVFLRRGDELLPALRAAVEGDTSPVEQLHALVDLEIGFFRRHRDFGRLYLRTSSATTLSPERQVDEAMRGRFQEAMDLQAGVIARPGGGEIRAETPTFRYHVQRDDLGVPGHGPCHLRRRRSRRPVAARRPARHDRPGSPPAERGGTPDRPG